MINNDDYIEPVENVVHACGHVEQVVSRCATAYRKRYCSKCALTLPKPSECLQRFMAEHDDVDHFGGWLGPIGAVVYARQSYFGISGMLAWSGSEAIFAAIDGMEASRAVTPYIERFKGVGL